MAGILSDQFEGRRDHQSCLAKLILLRREQEAAAAAAAHAQQMQRQRRRHQDQAGSDDEDEAEDDEEEDFEDDEEEDADFNPHRRAGHGFDAAVTTHWPPKKATARHAFWEACVPQSAGRRVALMMPRVLAHSVD